MRQFSFTHHLQDNKDVYNLIQNFQMIMLYSLQVEVPGMFRQFYIELRQIGGRSWKDCLFRNGCDIRKQLRDLHLSMPVMIAVPYLRLLFYFL
jgi:hypothetical protein